jgi:hypothetical protein
MLKSHDACLASRPRLASTSAKYSVPVLDSAVSNKLDTLEQHLLTPTNINSHLLSDPYLIPPCKMDRALDEIVAERHVRSRLCCSFQPCDGGFGSAQGGLANTFCRGVADLAGAVAVVGMIAMITLVTA